MKPFFAAVIVAVAATAASGQQDFWKESDLIQPETLAARLSDASAAKPSIFYVGFPVLYHSAHIPGAVLAGPASKAEGLEALKQTVAKLPRTSEIVIYCGCCPFDRCPNVRPAYTELLR